MPYCLTFVPLIIKYNFYNDFAVNRCFQGVEGCGAIVGTCATL
jgi:hypothetical protein